MHFRPKEDLGHRVHSNDPSRSLRYDGEELKAGDCFNRGSSFSDNQPSFDPKPFSCR